MDGCDFDWIEVAQSIVESVTMVVVSHTRDASPWAQRRDQEPRIGCLAKRGKAAVRWAKLAEIDLEKCSGCGKCVEIALMAGDAGLIGLGREVLAIAGTGEGSDTCIVLKPSCSREFLDLKVKKIVAMPR